MTPQRRQSLLDLGSDLQRAWEHPNAGNESRKRILRAVIKEIVVHVGDAQLELKVHWQGGDHTELSVVKNRSGGHRWTTDIEVERLLTELARLLPDSGIASLLNRLGHRTGKGNTWTEASVRSFRGSHHVAVYRQGEREDRGELTLEQAAEELQTSKMTVLRMIGAGALAAQQVCKGAPWVIKRSDLVRSAAHRVDQPAQKDPLTANPNQISLQFQ
jgi:excisionase family DNA binding protein